MSVDEFLDHYPPAIKDICNALRDIVSSLPVQMTEKVYTGWNLIGYRVKNGKRSHYVGYLAPMENEVRLGFENGVHLKHSPVPLQGRGKQVRYLSLTNTRQIDKNEIELLLLESIELALKGKR